MSNIENLSWDNLEVKKENYSSGLDPNEKPTDYYFIGIDLHFDLIVDPSTYAMLGDDYLGESDPTAITTEYFSDKESTYDILDKIATTYNLENISHDLDYMYRSEYSKYLFDEIQVEVTKVEETPEQVKFHIEFN